MFDAAAGSAENASFLLSPTPFLGCGGPFTHPVHASPFPSLLLLTQHQKFYCVESRLWVMVAFIVGGLVLTLTFSPPGSSVDVDLQRRNFFFQFWLHLFCCPFLCFPAIAPSLNFSSSELPRSTRRVSLFSST